MSRTGRVSASPPGTDFGGPGYRVQGDRAGASRRELDPEAELW